MMLLLRSDFGSRKIDPGTSGPQCGAGRTDCTRS